MSQTLQTKVLQREANGGTEPLQKQTLIKMLTQNQAELRLFGVAKLGLFGSFTRNEQRADSDIDLLVEFVPGQKTFDNFMQLSFFLEELLHRSVELVTPESLSPYIGSHIMNTVEYVVFND